MRLAAAALGVGLIFIVMLDGLRMTLGIRGGGPATRWFTDGSSPAGDRASHAAAPGVPRRASRPPVSILRSLRRAIGGLTDTLDEGFVSSIAADPPLPTVDMLEKHGVPTELDGLPKIGAEVDRRRRLLAFVRDRGDKWFENT